MRERIGPAPIILDRIFDILRINQALIHPADHTLDQPAQNAIGLGLELGRQVAIPLTLWHLFAKQKDLQPAPDTVIGIIDQGLAITLDQGLADRGKLKQGLAQLARLDLAAACVLLDRPRRQLGPRRRLTGR